MNTMCSLQKNQQNATKFLIRIQEIDFNTYISPTNWLIRYYDCPSHVLPMETLNPEIPTKCLAYVGQ